MRTAQQHGHRHVPLLLELAAAGKLDPSFLVTHRLWLEERPLGYELFKQKRDRVRVTFRPGAASGAG